MKLQHFLPITVIALTATSCQKVIQVDLNSASPTYVIEAKVNNSGGPGSVRITRTKNFDEANSFPTIPNAEVVISDNAGQNDTLYYDIDGTYKTHTLQGIPGRTYYLSVKVNGQTFSSSCVMPQQVMMDSLYRQDEIIFGDSIPRFIASYQDTPGVPNYYRFMLFHNGQRRDNIYINKDQYNDGLVVKRGFNYFENEDGSDKLHSGDSITIRMLCISEPVYTYFYTLDQTIGQNSASPANPQSNILGGALGYFSANTYQDKSVYIP